MNLFSKLKFTKNLLSSIKSQYSEGDPKIIFYPLFKGAKKSMIWKKYMLYASFYIQGEKIKREPAKIPESALLRRMSKITYA